ncbi:phosphoenolpyruvate synthase [Methylophaga sp. OBS4]|uniref:phosphoenolpyruvate synthase n=1 Tax=Methylophaga sp. OBS4 TaxID=2991935 RepID=UPI00224E0941|nr:phosphoenolpyruvate synthase [Methylophaga sp. OBS4]MCX4186454.1 phosphoenolpyruvate synthase [Methylophaga sp. OBS4]
MMTFQYIRPFAELSIDDIELVGGKNASLGEMYRELAPKGVKVPNGFATTAEAYRYFMRHNDLEQKIKQALDELDLEDTEALAVTGAKIRHWITDAEMPKDLAAEIEQAYHRMEAEYGPSVDVAVRSSATAEDLPDASFAGQQETHLNISGTGELLHSCRQIFASLFTNRAISYRCHKGFDHMAIALSVGVQKMVRSDKASSGVMFTIDTETGFRDVILITGAWGLGENVVQGTVNPDEFYVFKPTLASGHRPILKRQLGSKAVKMIYAAAHTHAGTTRNIEASAEERSQFCISDDEVLELSKMAVIIEQHYSKKAGHHRPMDVEWAKDGDSGELFIVQARPETVESTKALHALEKHVLEQHSDVITTGKSVGGRIAAGKVRVIMHPDQMHELKPGEILVTDITDPDWEPVMKRAGAIITNRGGRTCHAAIIARELGIAAIVGTHNGSQLLKTGDEVTVSCAEGDTGYVYKGILPFHVNQIDMNAIPKPENTKIMLNLANPEIAFETSMLPNSGVGLARMEFIINNSIRCHPNALLRFDQLPEDKKKEVATLTAGYEDPSRYYVERLAEGIANIAAAFYPKPVIVRLSDFKSNEYAALIGGDLFEPEEENPMLGFRGAARYPSPDFADAFALECEAIRMVRNNMGLTNIAVMIPFVRTVEEGQRVVDLMAKNGLKRGQDELKLYLMCEIPANVLLADQFLELCDGFSIGSNDLTQLTLGADRDSNMPGNYDERNEAVLMLIEMAIDACKKAGKYVGICGQAASDYPEITQFLVKKGISSISLNPDSVVEMTKVVCDMEQSLKHTEGPIKSSQIM